MTTWHVKVTGTKTNAGTEESPWNIETAIGLFNHFKADVRIKPGDVVDVWGGKYNKPSTDNGHMPWGDNPDTSKPITYRYHLGERVHIVTGTQYANLAVNFPNTRWWGLEGSCEGAARFSGQLGSFGAPLSQGFVASAENVEFIHCYVHDTCQGFSGFETAKNMKIYGSIAMYNGWGGSDRAHGHGVYAHGYEGIKRFEQNFVGDNAFASFQIYGSGGADIRNHHLINNGVWNSGYLIDKQMHYNLILGGGRFCAQNKIDGLRSYYRLSEHYGYNNLGQYTPSADNECINSVFVGGIFGVSVQGAERLRFRNNKVWVPGSLITIPELRLIHFGQGPGQSKVGFDWDMNAYYGVNMFVKANYDFDSGAMTGGGGMDFAGWQNNTGFDKNSIFLTDAPNGKWVYIDKSTFEAKRANITIYNLDLLPKVPVALGNVLNIGDDFKLMDAQNFTGPPVLTGKFDGNDVLIPMTALVKAAPVGIETPAHTAPEYGTFIVMPGGPPIFLVQPAPEPSPTPTPTPGPLPGPTPIPTPIPGGVMNINDRIFINNLGALTKVRSEPSAPDNTTGVIGTAAHNSFGVIKGGPQAAQTFVFWDVLLDSGLRGWIAEGYLRPSTEPLPGGTPVPTPSAHKTTLHWMPSVSIGITGYRVSRSIVQGGPYTHMVETTLSSIIDPTVEAGKKYYYVVQAVSPGGISVNSNEASGTIPNDGAPVPDPVPVPGVPLPPTNLTVTVE